LQLINKVLKLPNQYISINRILIWEQVIKA
jgi:hypothetical protein